MPDVRHPRTRDDVPGTVPARVTVQGDNHDVADGVVTLPTDAHVRALAEAYDVAVADIRVGDDADETADTDDTDGVTLSDGCPWCDEYDGDNVGQHASSAHPDEWTAYKDD